MAHSLEQTPTQDVLHLMPRTIRLSFLSSLSSHETGRKQAKDLATLTCSVGSNPRSGRFLAPPSSEMHGSFFWEPFAQRRLRFLRMTGWPGDG